jgi:hypothetical protein
VVISQPQEDLAKSGYKTCFWSCVKIFKNAMKLKLESRCDDFFPIFWGEIWRICFSLKEIFWQYIPFLIYIFRILAKFCTDKKTLPPIMN